MRAHLQYIARNSLQHCIALLISSYGATVNQKCHKYAVTHLDAFFSGGALSSWVSLIQENMNKVEASSRLALLKCIIIVSLIDGNFWMQSNKEEGGKPEGLEANSIKNNIAQQ